MSILNTIKMAWMIMWRISIILVIWTPNFDFLKTALLSIVVAAVVQYVFKVNVHTFPIIRLIIRKDVYTKSRKRPHNAVDTASTKSFNSIPGSAPVSNVDNVGFEGGMLSKPTASGRITGFEPRFMDEIELPNTPYMRGIPGVGLDSASHMTNYNVKSGKKGEVNFAKALSKTEIPFARGEHIALIDNVNSFWSIAMPSEDDPSRPDPKYKTDIDSIIVSGDNIVLVDTKFYASGDVTYTSKDNQLFCIDNTTGMMVNKPRKMSRNMSMALERFKKHYPDMHVTAVVVMMPTNAGSAKVNATWTGGIPVVTINQILQGLTSVAAESGINVKNRSVLTNLSMLRKR